MQLTNITLKPILKYLIVLLFLGACSEKKESDTVPSRYSEPKTVKVNTDGGYTYHTLTGDSIGLLISRAGDTLHTGVPLKIQGKRIDPDSLGIPIKVALKPKPAVLLFHKMYTLYPITYRSYR